MQSEHFGVSGVSPGVSQTDRGSRAIHVSGTGKGREAAGPLQHRASKSAEVQALVRITPDMSTSDTFRGVAMLKPKSDRACIPCESFQC